MKDLESSNLKIVLQGSIDMKKMAQEVALSLSSLVPTSSVGAPTVRESISSLGDKVYFQIIDYIIMLGKNLENYKDLNEKFNEEGYRDYFLPFLNAVSPHYSAKGEAFNRKGKTDILIFDDKGTNIFIAECKLWKGEAYLLSAVDQLLNNYVNWRDEKTAIIVFNRDTKKFSELILKATKAIARHPLCDHGAMDKRNDASWSYFFRHPDDEDRKIRLELVLLNFA